jgi:hypothetical protein
MITMSSAIFDIILKNRQTVGAAVFQGTSGLHDLPLTKVQIALIFANSHTLKLLMELFICG